MSPKIKQQSLTDDFQKYTKSTRKALFFTEMDELVPWERIKEVHSLFRNALSTQSQATQI